MEELFLNKGPESDLSLLGKAWTLDFLIAVETCFSFFSWAPGSALKKFAAIVNPEGKTYISELDPLMAQCVEFCGKTVFRTRV